MQYTSEQLKSQYQKLPENLKDALASVEGVETVKSIGKNYHLRIDEMSELSDEIGLVMLGLAKPEEFVTHIIARLGLDRAVAEGIAREVNEQIFLKIRESLQALHEGNKDNSNYGVEMLPNANPLTPATTLGAGETVPNKKEVIDGIEHPKEAREENVFEQKMGKLFRIPREEVDLDLYNEKPE